MAVSKRQTFACIECGKRVQHSPFGTGTWCVRCLFDLSPAELARYRGDIHKVLEVAR